MDQKQWQARRFYDGLRLAVGEDHYRLLSKGANWHFVNPFQLALENIDRSFTCMEGVPEDCGDAFFRRGDEIDHDTRYILYKRK